MLVDEVRRMRGRLSQYADVSPEPPLLSEFARGVCPCRNASQSIFGHMVLY